MNTTTKTEAASLPPCTCGEPACGPGAHTIARRQTADGITVKLWSDGAVTAGINTYVIRGARSDGHKLRAAVAAGWLVIGEVELYDHAELRALCVASRRAISQRSLAPRDHLRAVMRGVTFKSIKRGAVVRHASACACSACTAVRARTVAIPEDRRVYRSIALSNGLAINVRIQ